MRKKNKLKEEIQNRMMQRVSFKEKMRKHQQEMMILRQKRRRYEDKHIGNYKRSYPHDIEAKQKCYDKFLQALKAPGGAAAANKINQNAAKKEDNRK